MSLLRYLVGGATVAKGVRLLTATCFLVLSTSQVQADNSFFFESDAAKAKAAEEAKRLEEEKKNAAKSEEAAANEGKLAIGSFLSSGNSKEHITPPNTRASIPVNPEAPAPFIGLATAYFQGDTVTAKAYARQFVQYLSDLSFAVKDITRMIGEAMIEAKQIKEEDWDGVEQYLDYQLVSARQGTASPLKVTHQDALRKVKPDPKNEVEIFYFFTLNSSHSRKMTPQVEKLWQVVKSDPRMKFVALTLGPQETRWIEAYKKYTGLTAPVLNGQNVAKSFGVAFTPAIVVVTPNSPAAYVRTGEMEFTNLYEFVKTAQGESLEMPPEVKKLLTAKIGRQEKELKDGKGLITELYGAKSGGSAEGKDFYKDLKGKLEKF